jgi:hypothetical protein
MCWVHTSFVQCEVESDFNFVKNAKMKANMKKCMVFNPLFYHSKGKFDSICCLDVD